MNIEDAPTQSPELTWFKSSHSGAAGGECIEIAASPSTVHVRDSKDKAGAVLSFTADEWAAFVKFAAQH